MRELASVTVAILAGGAGSRFGGRDKGLVELVGIPLVSWSLQAVPVACRRLVVANRHHDFYAQFADVVSDATPGFAGPLAGILAALRAAKTDIVATLPVDCPAPPAQWLQRLLDGMNSSDSNAAVARDAQGRQPLFAVYRRARIALDDGDLGIDMPVWRWQDAIGAIDVDFSDSAAAFANINSEADRVAYEQRIAQ